jgi:hypothetical protein
MKSMVIPGARRAGPVHRAGADHGGERGPTLGDGRHVPNCPITGRTRSFHSPACR